MSPGSLYGDSGDTRLAALAAHQHGALATTQMRELGYSKHEIHHRVRTGRWQRLHRGVYLFGHPRITLRGRWMAAVLACGEGAVLSHHAAAALHDLRGAPWTPIDVTASARRNIDGIRCHCVRNLNPADLTVVDGIPVTTVERLLLDLAETLASEQRLRSLLEAAQRSGTFNLMQTRALIDRSPGRHGLKPLTRAIEALHDEAPWTQSELEVRLLELVRGHDLPEPRVNQIVEGELVDFLWPEHALIVEVDGYRYHRTHSAFEADRIRDARLTVAGYVVVRLTYRRITESPGLVAEQLRELLTARAALLSARAEPPPARAGR